MKRYNKREYWLLGCLLFFCLGLIGIYGIYIYFIVINVLIIVYEEFLSLGYWGKGIIRIGWVYKEGRNL